MDWYFVHVYSGYEARVQQRLESELEQSSIKDKFGRILVPQEQVMELVKGEKKIVARKLFPGYLMVEMDKCLETIALVKQIDRVTGFVGGTDPAPCEASEVAEVLRKIETSAEKPRAKYTYNIDDDIRIVDGPFSGFPGKVQEVNEDRATLQVLVIIFGRSTPVELSYAQVEKAT